MHKSLIGKRYGKLEVVELDRVEPRIVNGKKSGKKYFYKCKCDCGNECVVNSQNLGRNTNSCGCLMHDFLSERNTKHNISKTKIYKHWKSMKWRCKNTKAHNANNYYFKNIKVCDEWINNPVEFYNWAMNNGYKDGLTLDRIDNNKGYSPNNCRWSTCKEQSNNTSRNHLIKYNNEYKTISQWAEILNIKYQKLYEKLKQNNFKLDEIVKHIKENE